MFAAGHHLLSGRSRHADRSIVHVIVQKYLGMDGQSTANKAETMSRAIFRLGAA